MQYNTIYFQIACMLTTSPIDFDIALTNIEAILKLC